MSKKVQVSFSDSQIELLEKLRGEFGETAADVVRSVVLAWLAEKGLITAVVRERISSELTKESTTQKGRK